MTSSIGLVRVDEWRDVEGRGLATIEQWKADELLLLPGVATSPTNASQPEPSLLTLWRRGTHDVYVVVDARVQFIRPFGQADVLDTDGVPFTVASEWNEQQVAGDVQIADSVRRIHEAMGLTDGRLLTGRGMAVLSATVLESFEEDFLHPRGWSHADALSWCPDELAWYTAWVQGSSAIPFRFKEPLIAMLDSPGAQQGARVSGLTRTDLARGYIGAVWADSPGSRSSRSRALADAMTLPELASAIALRLTRRAPRVQRLLGMGRPR